MNTTHMAANKQFKIPSEDIVALANGYGRCIATDKITVEGAPVAYMHREAPQSELTGGDSLLGRRTKRTSTTQLIRKYMT